MPKVDVYDMSGSVVGEYNLSDDIFGIEINQDAIHQVVLNQLANKRQGTQSTKTISEVRGGGARPWRQKGTGRARQGSTRSAQWVGGGISLGPKPRSYSYTVPRKLKRLALKSALSSKVADKELILLEQLSIDEIKTKLIVEVLSNLNINEKVLVVIDQPDEKIQKSIRNIPDAKIAFVNTINVYDILKYEKFLVTKAAVSKIEEVYA
ncbi:MAG TPA: 50S ribosomal protein L4 [Clostridiales bacterium]|nr:50S ribosomal protein L4 [Clostridiales bacterium]